MFQRSIPTLAAEKKKKKKGVEEVGGVREEEEEREEEGGGRETPFLVCIEMASSKFVLTARRDI